MLNRLKYGPVAGRFTMRRRTSFLLSILPMTSIWMRSDPSLPNDRRPWSRDQLPHNFWEALEWRNEDLLFIYSIGSWLLVLSLSMNWRADPPTWVFFQSGVVCKGKGILYICIYVTYSITPCTHVCFCLGGKDESAYIQRIYVCILVYELFISVLQSYIILQTYPQIQKM